MRAPPPLGLICLFSVVVIVSIGNHAGVRLAIVLDDFKFADSVSVYIYDCDIRTKVASVVVFYVFRQAVKKATEFYSTTKLEYVIV